MFVNSQPYSELQSNFFLDSNMLGFWLESPPDHGLNAAGFLLSVSTIVLIFITYFAYAHASCGGNIPRLREPSGKKHFSLKTRWAYYTDCAGLFNDAYNNVRLASFPLFESLRSLLLTYPPQLVFKERIASMDTQSWDKK